MGLKETTQPITGDLAADNQRSERSILAADTANGQTLRLLAKPDSTTGLGGRLEVVITDAAGNPVIAPGTGTSVQTFTEVASLASSGTATLASYTVPALKVAYINYVSFSGDDVGTYDGQINATTIIRKHTVLTKANDDFLFGGSGPSSGLKLVAGDIFRVRVTNEGANAGDFSAFIGGIQIDA